MNNVPFMAKRKSQDGKLVIDHYPNTRYLNTRNKDRGIVTFAAEIAKKHAGHQRRVTGSQPRVLLRTPSRRKSVGVHDECRFPVHR